MSQDVLKLEKQTSGNGNHSLSWSLIAKNPKNSKSKFAYANLRDKCSSEDVSNIDSKYDNAGK